MNNPILWLFVALGVVLFLLNCRLAMQGWREHRKIRIKREQHEAYRADVKCRADACTTDEQRIALINELMGK